MATPHVDVVISLALLVNYFASNVASKEGFIVGGVDAKIKDYPHVAFLMVTMSADRGFICGSSILNQKILLTAAHCVYYSGEPHYDMTVVVGSSNKNSGVRHKVNDYLVHEGYRNAYLQNDIALMKVSVPLKLGRTVSRGIIMKNPPQELYGFVAGWGLVDEGSHKRFTDVMQSAKQHVWTNSQCSVQLGNIPRGTICGGDILAHDHAAPGDSGSALVIRKYIQVGLVSFKEPSVSESLVVYTNVAYFFDWIKSNAVKLAERDCHKKRN